METEKELKWWVKLWAWLDTPTAQEEYERETEVEAFKNLFAESYYQATGHNVWEFTKRQQQCVALAMQAQSLGIRGIQQWIADQLGITQPTVCHHLARANEKLKLKTLYLATPEVYLIEHPHIIHIEDFRTRSKFDSEKHVCAGSGRKSCLKLAFPGKYLCHNCFKWVSDEYSWRIEGWPAYLRERALSIRRELDYDAIAEVQHVEYFEDAA